jgi:hypothetical protein
MAILSVGSASLDVPVQLETPDGAAWRADYTRSPWWANHGVIGVAHQQSHDLATKVVTDPFGQFRPVVKVDCLANSVLDTSGTTYGFTDRCSFQAMGLTESDSLGVRELELDMEIAFPANYGDAENPVRWRTQSGSAKMPWTLGSYDPVRGSGSQPFSNNFAALAWASSLGAITKGPPGAEDYDKDRQRPSTFFSCSRAGGHTRTPQPNGTTVSMIQIYYHYGATPSMSGIGTASKPYVFIERGRWHKVRTYVRTNQAGQANGEYKVWWNGELVMHINDLQLMPSVARGINILHNQFFHGGPNGLDTTQSAYLGPQSITLP